MTMPVKKDLCCYKGQTYEQNMYFKSNKQPIDLTGITFKSQIKPMENTEELTAEFDVTVSGEEGKVSLELSDEVTAAMAPGTYVYDLKARDENHVKYWVYGKFIVSGRVTE